MKLITNSFIFVLLKVVRGDDFEQALKFTHNNSLSIEFRPVTHYACSVLFFIVSLMRYISTPYSNKIYLPLDLIRDAVANNWLDSLCYYVWMKKMHSKPVIYNFSLRKVSAGIKCSPTTVKTHISILKAHNLCHFYAATLILKSTKQLIAESKCQIVGIGVSHNKSQQRDLLRFAVIKRNLHCQYKAFITKSNVLQFLQGKRFSYKEAKALYRKNKRLNLNAESSLNSDLTLSNNKIGSLSNRSQSTGLKIQKAFNNLTLITSFKRVKQVGQNISRRAFYELGLDGRHFLSDKGSIYKRLSNGILLRDGTGEIVLC